jgi:hypothetical protein
MVNLYNIWQNIVTEYSFVYDYNFQFINRLYWCILFNSFLTTNRLAIKKHQNTE